MRLSVVVPTRNRPAHVVACAKSILATQGFVDLIVVDQSDDQATEQALAEIVDTRLRYIRTATRGVTLGRNLGIQSSDSEIVSFTDDDCRVRSDWVQRILDIFVRDPEVGVVCGRVVVPKEIEHLGYAERFEPQVREWHRRYPPLGNDWGITANMSMRRTVVEQVGAFDPMLGAGAPLRSGGEPDFLFRVLRGGWKVVNAEEVVVDHYGTRQPGAETDRLIRGYAAGMGAAFFKHVRLGDPMATWLYARFVATLVRNLPLNYLLGRRPRGLGFLKAFVSGSLASYQYRVDARQRLYVEK